MRKTILIILPIVFLFSVLIIRMNVNSDAHTDIVDSGHLYASWDTMEYDKCVAIWLIKRFVDTEAEFVFHPGGTEIQEGIVFDVPGADWSRQHRKCTSDCILETLTMDDPAALKMVKMAHDVELNFWQLDSFPEAQKSFQEVMTMLEKEMTHKERIDEILKYFDQMYLSLKENQKSN